MPKPSNHPVIQPANPANSPSPDHLTRAAAIARRRMLAATPGSQAYHRLARIVALFEFQLNKSTLNKSTPVRIPAETTDARV